MKNYLNTVFLYRKKFLKTGFNGKLFYNKENSTSNKQDEKKKRKREFGNLGTQFFLTRLILISWKLMLENFSSN